MKAIARSMGTSVPPKLMVTPETGGAPAPLVAAPALLLVEPPLLEPPLLGVPPAAAGEPPAPDAPPKLVELPPTALPALETGGAPAVPMGCAPPLGPKSPLESSV